MDEFDKYVNGILPSVDQPQYIKEILALADRPQNAGIGAEKQQVSAAIAYRVQNVLNATRPRGQAPAHRVTKPMKREAPRQSSAPNGEKTKIVQAAKKFSHFDQFK